MPPRTTAQVTLNLTITAAATDREHHQHGSEPGPSEVFRPPYWWRRRVGLAVRRPDTAIDVAPDRAGRDRRRPGRSTRSRSRSTTRRARPKGAPTSRLAPRIWSCSRTSSSHSRARPPGKGACDEPALVGQGVVGEATADDGSSACSASVRSRVGDRRDRRAHRPPLRPSGLRAPPTMPGSRSSPFSAA